jgi:hypothetical protein
MNELLVAFPFSFWHAVDATFSIVDDDAELEYVTDPGSAHEEEPEDGQVQHEPVQASAAPIVTEESLLAPILHGLPLLP